MWAGQAYRCEVGRHTAVGWAGIQVWAEQAYSCGLSCKAGVLGVASLQPQDISEEPAAGLMPPRGCMPGIVICFYLADGLGPEYSRKIGPFRVKVE